MPGAIMTRQDVEPRPPPSGGRFPLPPWLDGVSYFFFIAIFLLMAAVMHMFMIAAL